MPDEPVERNLHSEDEIWSYLVRNGVKAELIREMSVGFVSQTYHVILTDIYDWNHKFRIKPAEIDADIAKQAKRKVVKNNVQETAKKLIAAPKVRQRSRQNAKDQDRER